MVKKSSNIKERILQISDYKGITRELFFEKIGMTYGNFKGKSKETPINSNTLAIILTSYPDIDAEWLLLGKGEMVREDRGNIKVQDFVHATEGSASGVPVHTLPPTEKETDMSEKEIIEMQKGYIASLKFQVDTLTKENQALAKELKSSKSHEEVVKNM